MSEARHSELVVVGSSHHSTPISLRERLAVGEQELPGALKALREELGLREAVLVSTCNRVEIYAAARDPAEALLAVRRWMSERAGVELGGHLYERSGPEAVRHTFRVAASLDSMVVGEPQILGQLKGAYATAQEAGGVGSLLGRAFSHAFRVAKQVRHETRIASGSVSVSSVATDLAKKIFGDLRGRRALLVGAGEMGESAARHLKAQGARLLVANRSRERAFEVAQAVGGEPRSLDELAEELALADVVIASTSAKGFVITRPLMRQAVQIRRRRPLFLIDIAVPRDIDPSVGDMDNVFVYDVDDLQKIAAGNLETRKEEAAAAERIVAQETEAFLKWRKDLDLKPLIVGLRARFDAILEEEIERTLSRLKGDPEADRRSLGKMKKAAVSKLLHRPITELKKAAEEPEGELLLEHLRRLFELPEEAEGSELERPSSQPSLRAIPGGRRKSVENS